MQINGPTQIQFGSGVMQVPLPVTVTGASGTVTFKVTQVPSSVVSVRKSSTSTPLAIGDILTTAEAANLVATRPSASSAIISPLTFAVTATEAGAKETVTDASTAGVRTRVFPTGATPPAFTIGDVYARDAVKNENFWVPDTQSVNSGTMTVDVLIDLTTARALTKVLSSTQFQIGYGPGTSANWSGVSVRALTSANGTAVSTSSVLSVAPAPVDGMAKKRLSGVVSGASAARFVGFRFLNVPALSYPMILQGFDFEMTGAAGTANYSCTITEAAAPVPAGSAIVYGDPGTRFPLGIYLRGKTSSYQLNVPAGLTLVRQVSTPTTVNASSSYAPDSATGPYVATQTNGGASSSALRVEGSGATFSNGLLSLPQGSFVTTDPLGLAGPSSSDASKDQAPASIAVGFTGTFGTDTPTIASIVEYAKGGVYLIVNWEADTVMLRLERDGQIEEVRSAAVFPKNVEHAIVAKWADNPSGPGGTVTFTKAGLVVGNPITTSLKPRITPAAALESNAVTGNTAAGGTVSIRSLSVAIDKPSVINSYVPVTSGTVSAAVLESLYVDATGVSSTQPARTLTYQPAGGSIQSLDVVVGPYAVAAGTAYRAVLEDWSSGSAVSHPNALVMTKAVRQNCRFEDSFLYGAGTSWTECLPTGPVPVIGGIAYYCEAIRMAGYTQFQFGYDWSNAVMPNNPFGDPTGLESYMVPHKWRIEDQAGNVLGRVERADGGPLNGPDTARIWEGSYDGNGLAMTSPTNRWYPHGTVRAGLIWRSGNPAAFAQADITAQLPRYDDTVPFGGHTGYSNNGGDLRITTYAQANGFGNTRVMPYEPSDYTTQVGRVGITQDPYKGLYNASSLAAVGATWLKYTAFNQMGRSPLTGPGGVRDDRAAIPEPVVHYMYATGATRPHDGKPYAAIALDYLTGYVSDPFHCFEGGRNVPLFKGANASRVITMRDHYYGAGEGSTPPERAYYVMSGREYEIVQSAAPLRVFVPSKGSTSTKPYFGTNAIDGLHAHQYPYWGSLLFKTPEFAFLGAKFFDQARLYENMIIAEPGAQRCFDRPGAWSFLHAVLAWKTASANSDRLYTQAEVLAFAVQDFEEFSDMHKAGFDNPPANVYRNGQLDYARCTYAGALRFGACLVGEEGLMQHDFSIGYWLTALGIGERLGFNAALRAASVKAGAVLDFLIAQHRKRIVGRINEAPRANLLDNSYTFVLWRRNQIAAANGSVAGLPQTYAAVAQQNGNASAWDRSSGGGTEELRDGQAMDQLMAGPSLLLNQLGQSGSDLNAASATVDGWRTQKKNEQLALGVDAGSTWFKFLNAVNNPAIS